jgi:anti-sigma regulatory factor (Ser/Thr protein kinase)
LNWGAVIHSFQVSDSTHRERLVIALEGMLDEMSCPRYIVDRAATIAEELLTNALYDAPVGPDYRRIAADRPRTKPVILPSPQEITFSFGSDGNSIAIACRDPFGSLEPEMVLGSLARCFRRDEEQISDGPGGAGLGIYLTYNLTDHLIVNIERGKATEFIGVVSLNRRKRSTGDSFKPLNIFTL